MAVDDILPVPEVDIDPLQSEDNYASWVRDFEDIARHKNLWTLYTGTEADLNESNRGDFEDTKKGEHSYQYALEDYEEQQERKCSALSIISFSVDHAMRREFLEYDDPARVFDFIKTQCRRSDYRACQAAYTHMESIRLTSGKSMTILLHEIIQCQLDIKEAKGEYSDDQVINKISRSLTREYDDFIRENITFADKAPSIDGLTARLVALELEMTEWAK